MGRGPGATRALRETRAGDHRPHAVVSVHRRSRRSSGPRRHGRAGRPPWRCSRRSPARSRYGRWPWRSWPGPGDRPPSRRPRCRSGTSRRRAGARSRPVLVPGQGRAQPASWPARPHASSAACRRKRPCARTSRGPAVGSTNRGSDIGGALPRPRRLPGGGRAGPDRSIHRATRAGSPVLESEPERPGLSTELRRHRGRRTRRRRRPARIRHPPGWSGEAWASGPRPGRQP